MTNAHRFFSHVYRDDRMRALSDRRRIRKDLLYYARNRSLQPVEWALQQRYRGSAHPVVFIVGVPRSGTTLLYQLMSRFLRVGYVTNRMARYWMTPIAGAILSGGIDRAEIGLESRFGVGGSEMSPHEFSWFWQFYGFMAEQDQFDERALEGVDWGKIARSLRGLAGYFDAPLVLKNLNYVDYQIAWISRKMPDAKFIWMRRDEAAAARSILKVREDRYGDRSLWWSVRPRDYESWAKRSPEDQVAHQVQDIGSAIERSFSSLDASKGFTTSYEELTASPSRVLSQLAEFLGVNMVDPASVEHLRLDRTPVSADQELEGRIAGALAARK